MMLPVVVTMGSFFRHYFFRLRSSYWFIPGLMAVGAILFSFLCIYIDSVIGASWMADFSWLYANKPEGARGLLTTIAGSMITVAGVTFSITIVSVTAAAGRFGPRILTNFMSDRGNQLTLGVFIATFLYSLLILRTVRGANEAGASLLTPENDPTGLFVPHISILLAILLAIASIGVLIYFVHHVPESIHISNVTARIGRQLEDQVNRVFIGKATVGSVESSRTIRGVEAENREDLTVGEREMVARVAERGEGVELGKIGYIEQINGERIIALASRKDVTIQLCRAAGEFVNSRTEVVRVWPPGGLSEEAKGELRQAYLLGPQRTAEQDIHFPIDELIEVATIALSPGVNDPFTALTCLEWLAASFVRALELSPPQRFRFDEGRTLRVIAPPLDVPTLLNHTMNLLRPQVAASSTVAIRLMELLGDIVEHAGTGECRAAILAEANDLYKGVKRNLADSKEGDRFEEVYGRMREIAVFADPKSG